MKFTSAIIAILLIGIANPGIARQASTAHLPHELDKPDVTLGVGGSSASENNRAIKPIDISSILLEKNQPNAENELPEGLIMGRENCPDLWDTFINWHSNFLTVGPTVEDDENAWLISTGFNPGIESGFYKKKPVMKQADVLPVMEMNQFEAIAVICNMFSRTFVAAYYLDQDGEQGSLILMRKEDGEHWVYYGMDADPIDKDGEPMYSDATHLVFGHAVKHKLFEPIPDDYQSIIESLSTQKRFELAIYKIKSKLFPSSD